MAYDLLIKHGTVIDGTGAARFEADVAIAQGRVVEIGRIKDGAAKVIDADGLIVAPGFIDPHTHYDAQICWDREISCSSWHGVTSVIMGNCGVGLAPCKPEAREVAAWDLVNVEGIPFPVLSQGVTWDWTTFPEFMDAAARRQSALNLGFFAPLSPFRHFVMGEHSTERGANPEEIQKIAALLDQAMGAGAMGFTTTTLVHHIGFEGRPLACRLASRAELSAYAHVLREQGKGAIEIALTKRLGQVDDDEYELLESLLNDSQRPITWLAMGVSYRHPERLEQTLQRVEPLRQRGAIPQITCRPFVTQHDLRNPFVFADEESWKPVFNKPAEVQKKIFADPDFRRAYREELAHPKPRLFNGRWHRMEVLEVNNPALKKYEGRNVVQVAEERGRDPLDTFFDLALEDDLNIQYTMTQFNEEGIRQLVGDSRTLVGLSDGGAHVDMLCDAGYATFLLGHWVRERQALDLEQAVKRITSEPADFFGIKQRGRLKPGLAADITVFDPNTVDSGRRAEIRHDLPGGGKRLVMPSRGIEHTMVNGELLFERGKPTGALPGQVLRSGKA